MTVLVILAFAIYVMHGLVWPYSLPPTRQLPEPDGFEDWSGFLHLHELETS